MVVQHLLDAGVLVDARGVDLELVAQLRLNVLKIANTEAISCSDARGCVSIGYPAQTERSIRYSRSEMTCAIFLR